MASQRQVLNSLPNSVANIAKMTGSSVSQAQRTVNTLKGRGKIESSVENGVVIWRKRDGTNQ